MASTVVSPILNYPTSNTSGFWNSNVWTAINGTPSSNGSPGTPGLVQTTAAAVRVCQNVFQPLQLYNVTSIPADQFDPIKMSITEGITKPYVELAVEFGLTNGQVNADPTGCAAKTLAQFAARDLALAEDLITLQGEHGSRPASVRIESGEESLKGGILGLIPEDRTIEVKVPDASYSTHSGLEIWAAIQSALALLQRGTQSTPWAIIADTAAFAAIASSVLNGNPLLGILTTSGPALISGGIQGTPAMPANTAIVIALGGTPTNMYYDNDAQMEPTHKASAGRYFFRVFERVQTVARDPRAFVKLEFKYLSAPHPTPRTQG